MQVMKRHFIHRMVLLTLFTLLASVVCAEGSTGMTNSLCSRRFTTLEGLPQMQTETVWQDSRGYVYVGTLSGFARYDGNTLTPLLYGHRDNILAFAEIDGKVHALGFRRQWIVDGDDVSMHQIDESRQWLLNNFNSPALPSGIILLEDDKESHRRLCRLEESGFSVLLADTLMDRMMPDRKLYIDAESVTDAASMANKLYMPTDDGLYMYDGKRFRQISDKTDFFALHRTGNLLYALAGDGLYTVSGGKVTLNKAYTFEAPDYGLTASHDQQGRLIIADSHSIYVYDGKEVTKVADGFNLIKGLLTDKWGRLWLTTYQGLYCYFTMNFNRHHLTDGNDIVRALAVNSGGEVVMATLNGKVLVGDDVVSDTPDYFYIAGSAVLGDKVYVAGRDDLHCIEGHTAQRLNLPYNRYQFVTSALGKVVFGARNMVLAYDTGSGTTDTLCTDLPHPWCAAADDSGNLWVGTTGYVYKLSRQSNGAWQSTCIDYPQNLVATAMDADRYGNIVFSSVDSLFVIRNGAISELNSRMPLLHGHEVRSVHVSPKGYLVVGVIDGLIVARVDSAMNVSDATLFNYNNGFAIVEPQQSPMAETSTGIIWLAGLEEMVSFDVERLMQQKYSDMYATPQTRWWQRWWIWLALLIPIVAMIWILARRYERQRTRRQMATIEREKTLKELQVNAIRLKSIPHFNSNVLSGIEYFVMNHSVDEATYYLGLYSRFTNTTLADIDRAARTVDEEVDYLENYLKLQKMRYGDKLTYNITVDDDVNRQALIPNMLLHTYTENAIKHGITHKDSPGNVDVRVSSKIREGHRWVIVSVTDDGIGRKAAGQLHEKTNKMGLNILMEQVQLLNQMNRLHITQHVTDLKDSIGKPLGTQYVMEIPEGYRYDTKKT